jgi:hypothetical protein
MKTVLQLTGDHARRFPRGVLGEEREALAIEALARAGQTAAAAERFVAFDASFPRSSYRQRLIVVLGKQP